MPVNGNNVVRNPAIVEYGKFLELTDQSLFPAISVTRYLYPDTSEAYNIPLSTLPLTSVDIYPKYAVLTHLVNASDISVSLSAGDINVNLSDVENLIIRNNTLVNSISAQVSTMDARVFNINSHVNTIDTRTSAITALLTSTNTLVNSVSALLGNQLGINGFRFCQPSDGAVINNFNALQVVSACKFSQIGATNSNVTGFTTYELPQNFSFTAPITSFTLSYGAVIAYK
jgi:hypothetical protein